MSDKMFNMAVLETLITCGKFKVNRPDCIVTINQL